MSKYMKRPVIVEASQWYVNGDHPQDGCTSITSQGRGAPEGKVVRYFRHPVMGDISKCAHCHTIFHFHGWIDTLEGGHSVCPGDWIITGVKGEYYPCKPDIFRETYDPVVDDTPAGQHSGGY